MILIEPIRSFTCGLSPRCVAVPTTLPPRRRKNCTALAPTSARSTSTSFSCQCCSSPDDLFEQVYVKATTKPAVGRNNDIIRHASLPAQPATGACNPDWRAPGGRPRDGYAQHRVARPPFAFCALRIFAAATISIALVIFCMFFTLRILERISFSLAMLVYTLVLSTITLPNRGTGLA